MVNRRSQNAVQAYPWLDKSGGKSPAWKGCGRLSGLQCVPTLIKVFKEKNPEITDEALMKLADDLREMGKQQEKDEATKLEENKSVQNKPAATPKNKKSGEKKKPSTQKSTTNRSKK